MEINTSINLDQQAGEDFHKARQLEFFSRIQHFFNPGNEELMSLQEVKSIIKPKGETYKGMATVPVKLIVGSEGRYHDFNQAFLPRHDYLRSRWTNVDKAHYQDIILPPIRLYEIGGLYFVRDGNHRVSVARMQGITDIDAEVISLNSEVRLRPHMTSDEMVRAMIAYEKDLFYEETYFGIITDYYSLDFTNLGQYDIVYNHILVHKYYINQSSSREIPLGRAIRSWFENVYSPAREIIEAEGLCSLFAGKTVSDIYLWIIRYWDDLKAAQGSQYPLSEAVKNYAKTFGEAQSKGLGLILSRLKGALARLLRPRA